MTHDVLIVGGGPVGMGLAIELGQRGIDTCVIERHETPQRVPKGQNLTQRTMEHMQAWGVEDQIRAAKTIPKGVGLGGLTAYGSLLSGIHYDWFRRASVARYYAAENERLPQYATESVLRKRVLELPSVTVHYGETGLDLVQDADGVTLTTDSNRHIAARYLIGSDGSRSRIREAAGITETRRDHDRLMALLVFRSPALFELLKRFPDKQFYNALHPDLDGYWMFFGMVDWGETFFFHAPVPTGTDRETFDFAGFLHRAVGQEFPLELEYVGFWDLRIAYANSYRAGRVFLAGDAAHSHPPYGGYGINTGFEDARNLGWKLAATLQGWGGNDLLDSYDAERRLVFESTARDFIERFIEDDREFLRSFDPEHDRAAFDAAWAARASDGATAGIGAYAPHYSGSPIICGGTESTPSARGEHRFEARAGHHLAPQQLADGCTARQPKSEDFVLLSFGAEGAEAEDFRNAANRLRLPLRIVKDDTAATQNAYGAKLVLVRPDGFVAWAADRCSDPLELLRMASGHNGSTGLSSPS